jgi:sulfatase maturation enzyme AslB (radical SAM superfamily)
MKPDDLSTTFCALPFVHISNTSSGEFVPCCFVTQPITDKNARVLNIADGDTFEAAFQSPFMNQLRYNLKNNIQDPLCSACWKMEADGIQSKRQYDGGRFLKKAIDRAQMDACPTQPLSWDIKLGSLCNLKCRMCDNESSSALLQEEVQRGLISTQKAHNFLSRTTDFTRFSQFQNELLRMSEFVEEIYFLGGEPTLNRNHLKILDTIISSGRAQNVTIRWSTNLTHFGDDFISRAKLFKSSILDFSIDGCSSLYEYIRYPAQWDKVCANSTKIRKELPEAEIKVVCTVSLFNIAQLDQVVNWSREGNLTPVFNYLSQPSYLSAQNLDTQTKKLLTQKYVSKADPIYQELVTWLNCAGDPRLLLRFFEETERLDTYRSQDFFDAIDLEAKELFLNLKNLLDTNL